MKAKDHKKITKKAIEIFADNSSGDFAAQLLRNSKKVESGAAKEDTFPLYRRITNWHFFKQNEYLCPKTVYYAYVIPLPVIPTSGTILEQRIGEMLYQLDKKIPLGMEDMIGRVLHHIQDMSTPAHAVPVYHGLLLQDSFERYSCENIDVELQTINITKEECECLYLENNTEVISIYNNAAFTTLNYLYDTPSTRFEIGDGYGDTQVGWDLFWKRNNDDMDGCSVRPFAGISGFGCYGPLGKKYGESSVELHGKRYSVEPEIYRQLHRWLLREQINNSLRTLFAADSRRRSLLSTVRKKEIGGAVTVAKK